MAEENAKLADDSLPDTRMLHDVAVSGFNEALQNGRHSEQNRESQSRDLESIIAPGQLASDPALERAKLQEENRRREEWNDILEKALSTGQHQTAASERTREAIVLEGSMVHMRTLFLEERLVKADEEERARIRDNIKSLAERKDELQREYLTRRTLDTATDVSHEQSIRVLRTFAKDRAQANYTVAEVAIAMNLANQLEAGVKRIDLSQRYLTDSVADARDRHRRAIEYLHQHLGSALRHAEKHVEHFDYGKAIAHGSRQSEVLAISNRDMKRGIGNVASLLQSAGNHHRQVVESPRLSMNEGAVGGL